MRVLKKFCNRVVTITQEVTHICTLPDARFGRSSPKHHIKLARISKKLWQVAPTEKALGTLKQFRFAESVTLMTAEREGAKASQGAKNHKIFVVALPGNA